MRNIAEELADARALILKLEASVSFPPSASRSGGKPDAPKKAKKESRTGDRRARAAGGKRAGVLNLSAVLMAVQVQRISPPVRRDLAANQFLATGLLNMKIRLQQVFCSVLHVLYSADCAVQL